MKLSPSEIELLLTAIEITTAHIRADPEPGLSARPFVRLGHKLERAIGPDARSRDIIHRYCAGEKMGSIAASWDISAERVRQILRTNGIGSRKTA